MTRSGNTRPLMHAAPLLLTLTGCSPHPATGNWESATADEHGFARLEVTYEGRAHLFEAGETEAGRRCFWSGESAHAIAMTCKPATNPDTEERYRLIINTDGTATLMRDNAPMAHFSRPAQ